MSSTCRGGHLQCDKGTVPLSHSQKWARQRRAHSLYSIQPHLTRTAESSRNRGAGRRALPLNEFRTNRRRQWRLRRESGLSEIERQGPAPGPSVPVYESDVLSNSLKSFGLPLPRLAFMHWPTKKPMTFWFPSRYCCACSAQFASTSSTIGCSAPASLT